MGVKLDGLVILRYKNYKTYDDHHSKLTYTRDLPGGLLHYMLASSARFALTERGDPAEVGSPLTY